MNTASAEDYKKAERAIKTKKRQPNQNQSQPQLKQLLQQLKTGQSQKGGQQRQKKKLEILGPELAPKIKILYVCGGSVC